MRPAEEHETRAITEGLTAWGSKVADVVIGDREIWIDEDVVRLVSPSKLPAELRDDAVAGLAIGRLEDGFILGLPGAVRGSHFVNRGLVRVQEKAARLFVYGRNILPESVTEYDRRLKRGDACIVVNPRREALGVGMIVGNFKGSREVVEPLHELGTYLRDQDA